MKARIHIDLTGRRFDKLIVVAQAGWDRHRHVLWLCACSCGNHITKITANLLHPSGKTFGCRACASRAIGAAKRKHGEAGTRLYWIWKGMRQRCENPANKMYRWYGSKGVAVCTAWHEYADFASWALASGYVDGLTIDRINSTGIYEPSNCEWVTRSENSRRRNVG